MSRIRIACQTYTWEMLGPDWRGSLSQILDWVAAAGYAGIEVTNTMIGEFGDRPREFAAALAERGLSLAAFAYSTTGFTDPQQREADLAGARRALEFVRHFPEPRLGLGGAASPTRPPGYEALDRAISFYNEVGALAAPVGVKVCVHPHSHHGSILETAAEYGYLMSHLDPALVSLGPDTGHIVRGGQDLLTCLRAHLPRLTHLHVKDVNDRREWVGLGQGRCDFTGVMRLLEAADYSGWVVAEEESDSARRDGVGAIRRNREYLRSIGY